MARVPRGDAGVLEEVASKLNAGLLWNSTPEGGEFWYEVHRRLHVLAGAIRAKDKLEEAPVKIVPVNEEEVKPALPPVQEKLAGFRERLARIKANS